MCSDFLAGDSLRSSRRYHALDETALFGCTCRHEYPRLFINLRHGERSVFVQFTTTGNDLSSHVCFSLAYIVWLLEALQHQVSPNVDMYVIYDIACSLVQHLKAKGAVHLLEGGTKFALPSFHAYGHNAQCQVSKHYKYYSMN